MSTYAPEGSPQTNLEYSKQAVAFTSHNEGCVLHAYPDAGGWSIGWGYHGPEVHEGMTCTQAQADAWRAQKLQEASDAVNKLVRVTLTQDQFDALVDFTYNLGVGALQQSTLLRKLNQGDYKGAAAELPKWDHVNGLVNQNLLARRLEEKQIFEKGVS